MLINWAADAAKVLVYAALVASEFAKAKAQDSPGGKTVTPYELLQLTARLAHQWEQDAGGEYALQETELLDALSAAGFTVVQDALEMVAISQPEKWTSAGWMRLTIYVWQITNKFLEAKSADSLGGTRVLAIEKINLIAEIVAAYGKEDNVSRTVLKDEVIDAFAALGWQLSPILEGEPKAKPVAKSAKLKLPLQAEVQSDD